MDDTETKVASDVKAALARYRVLESDLLHSLRALPREEASKLAAELRACASDDEPNPRGQDTAVWSTSRGTLNMKAVPVRVSGLLGASANDSNATYTRACSST